MNDFPGRTSYEDSRLQTAEDLGIDESEIFCPKLAGLKLGMTPDTARKKVKELGGFKHRGRVFFRRAVVEKYVKPSKPAPKIKLKAGETVRRCLCCGRMFASWGVGNRLCGNCR